MSYNKVTLIGRVGKDPEVKQFDNGGSITSFPFATSETYKDKQGERKEDTEWHNVVFPTKLQEIVQKYVRKGDQLHIEGKVTTRSWEKDGEKRYITEIKAFGMVMLGSKGNSEGKPEAGGIPAAQTGYDDGEDLPF